MKKFNFIKGICIIALICICFVLPSFLISAAEENIVSIETENDFYQPGDTVTVTIISNSETDLHGYQMDILYDANVLEYKNGNFSTTNNWYNEISNNNPGVLRMLSYDNTDEISSPVTGKTEIYSIAFQIKETSPTGQKSNITIDKIYLSSKNGNLISAGTGDINVSLLIENEPDGESSSTEQPESSGSSTEQPKSSGSSTEQPESSGSSTEQPESSGSSTEQPESSGSSTKQPESSDIGTEQPESSISSRLGNVSTGDNTNLTLVIFVFVFSMISILFIKIKKFN